MTEPIFDAELVLLGDLKPHPRNYQEHPPDQIEHIIESIRENGIYRNIVITRENTILAGHGVVKALIQMGRETAPAIRLDLDPNSPQALKVVAGDNEISHLAMRDDRALTELLKQIKEQDPVGLLGTGYDELMLTSLVMVTRPQSEIGDFDEAAEWVGMPEYDPGSQIYRLTISFMSEEERSAFLEKQMGIKGEIVQARGKNNLSTWWPPRDKTDDLLALRFEVRER